MQVPQSDSCMLENKERQWFNSVLSLKGQDPGGQLCNIRCESQGPRTRSANVQGQEKMVSQLSSVRVNLPSFALVVYSGPQWVG